MKKVILLSIFLFSMVILSAQGINQMWGMLPKGGASDGGVIFRTDAAGDNYQVKYQFISGSPGTGQSLRPQLTEYNGKFYGVNAQGGSHDKGVIFEWVPATNLYTIKFDFDSVNGANPGSLTLNGGKFYGTTSSGGANNLGVIFEWDPATNIYTKRYDLVNSSGPGPLTFLNGKYYGPTREGFFEWDPVTNIYNLKFALSIPAPWSLGGLTAWNGKFYGLARSLEERAFNGIIFEWDPVTNIFTIKQDLSYPAFTLTLNGDKFYGMAYTTTDNVTYDHGTIFEWDPATNVYTKKIDFTEAGGYDPLGNLAFSSGKFYGTTSHGGINGLGAVFEWDPATNVYTKKVDYSSAAGNYTGGLTPDGGKLYGLFFVFDPATNVYTYNVNFNSDFANGANPSGSLTQLGNTLWGMTSAGGSNNKGVIFSLDLNPLANLYTKRYDLTDAGGCSPAGNSLVSFGGKLYGMTTRGGSNNQGVIFEWNPATNTYTKKFDFSGTNGIVPSGNLTLAGNKFYGMTFAGGVNEAGVIFEWDPATNVYTKKFDFARYQGNPYGSLTLYQGKFYGMGSTSIGGGMDESGANVTGAGFIFEWDPATNVYTDKKILYSPYLTAPDGPRGNLTLCSCGGKFYGLTLNAGPEGNIFEWNPSTNVFTGRGFVGGYGSLTKSGGKLYYMTQSGILEWDPATGSIESKKEWSPINNMDGAEPTTGNDLTLVQAPVARGLRGSCLSVPAVTINENNNNKWVSIVDDLGNAVAEIKANGNNLGVINTSLYVNNASVREDLSKRLYLDRNITITPQSQPASPVDIRLYIQGSEYESLKSAVNSLGEPSGISSINDLGIFKLENNSCSSTLNQIDNPVASTITDWRGDYVLSGSIGSFSTFYFANRALVVLPLTLTEFNGRLLNNNGLLNWKINNEQNTDRFEIERSIDGRNYSVVGTINSANTAGIHNYSFTDPKITLLGASVVYYRLKQKDLDGRFTYSRIIALSINNGNIVLLYPNPVIDAANLTITVDQPQQLQARVIDAAGKTMSSEYWRLSAGSTSLSVDVRKLAKGMYYLQLKGATVNERKQFSKQ